jgi:hypothetical protein
MNIETLSERKLEDLYNKRFRDDAAQSQACIAAGMGNWTPRQRDEALRGQIDATDAQIAVCRDWLASSVAFREVCDEQARRERYHGSRKPIRKAA